MTANQFNDLVTDLPDSTDDDIWRACVSVNGWVVIDSSLAWWGSVEDPPEWVLRARWVTVT